MDDTGPVDFNESTVNRPLSSTDSKPLSILNTCIRSPLNRRTSNDVRFSALSISSYCKSLNSGINLVALR